MKRLIGLFAIVFCALSHANVAGVHLDKAPTDLRDVASLQRGAGVYMNYCQGCHTLQYMRYNRVAADLGLTDAAGKVNEQLVKKYLNFVGEKSTEFMVNSMPKAEVAKWFGKVPPDLTLEARVRGKDWLYTYLRTFYLDESRPWGVNNLVFKDVGMPHVLVKLQGTQVPVYEIEHKAQPDGSTHEVRHIVGLELKTPGLLSVEEYDTLVGDLVNFLDYIAEPTKLDRYRLGGWAMLFLVIFLVFAYLLKREYWKDVH